MITKKLLIFSAFCGIFAFGLILSEPAIESVLPDKSTYYWTILRWTVGISFLAALALPFGIFLYHLSDWVEKLRSDSNLYDDK